MITIALDITQAVELVRLAKARHRVLMTGTEQSLQRER